MRLHTRQRLTFAALAAALAGCGAPPAPPPPAAAPPAPPAMPTGDLGRSVARGRAIMLATRDSLPTHVGNELRCTSCHLDEGRRANAMPWTGVYARFPQYRARAATVQRLEDRINDCFERSMNGKALAWDDPAMRDIVAYMAWLSADVPVGGKVPGQGVPLADATTGDTVAGAAVFGRACARCHGDDGDGRPGFPAVWGPRSYSIGAGMARLRTAAGFIRHNMPFDAPGSLSDREAVDVAAYVVSRPRADFAGKVNDWPHGDPPPDVAYPTRAGRRPATP